MIRVVVVVVGLVVVVGVVVDANVLRGPNRETLTAEAHTIFVSIETIASQSRIPWS